MDDATLGATTLLLPGLGGSGIDHWQTLWATERAGCHVVEQAEWERPTLHGWLAGLELSVGSVRGPYYLAAHSLGCALAAHWLTRTGDRHGGAGGARLRGVMLVAPADVDSPERTPGEARSFAPMPQAPLPCRSLVVCSSDDPYVDVERAKTFAAHWRSTLIEVGARGHINASSGLGDWQEGWLMLRTLMDGEPLP